MAREVSSDDVRDYPLQCGHIFRSRPNYAPKIGELVYCFACDAEQPRTTVGGWKIKCRQCVYSRTYGEAPVTADTRASVHAARKGHEVDVWHTETTNSRRTVGSQREMLTDIAPF